MAIKAGSIIHVGNNNGVVIDRIQTGGPGQLNIPVEIVRELGNYLSVGQIRDIPDLSFSMDSYDVSLEIEEMLLGLTPGNVTSTTVLTPTNAVPVDIKSIFKGQLTADPFATVASVALPYLTLEQLSYRFGLTADASQTATLRGDSIYYNPGSCYLETTAGTNTANQTITTVNPAYAIVEGGVQRRILSVEAGSKRLILGTDYTESYGTVSGGAATTTITITSGGPVPTTSNIRIMYSSPTVEEWPQSVNATTSVKPAAIRGRDIAVYLGGYNAAHPYTNRLRGVQATTTDWRVSLQKNEEFGNYHFVSQDYEVPTVTGTVQVRTVDAPTLVALIQQITGVTDPTQSTPATVAPVIPLDIILHDPVSGGVLKHLSVPDARFSVPGFSGRVQQKLDVTINFTSDQGVLNISQT